jgi:hypothetical protein
MIVLAGAAAVWCAAPLAASAAPDGTWHTAIEVPGSGALNKDGYGLTQSLSCGSAGNCAAGGFYTDSAGHEQAFVVSESNGTWGKAIEVPGTAALDKGAGAGVDSVSCASAGNCAAGGAYTDSAGHGNAFVVSESNGTWGTAIQVPGTAALDKGEDAYVNSVSCASAGNCAAGGVYYTDSAEDDAHPFVVSESNGTWHTAIQVPGIAALDKSGIAVVSSVACGSAGNCGAVGGYETGVAGAGQQAFVVSESNGTWHTAIQVPGLAALNKGEDASAGSVSCGSAGNCAAGGYYSPSGSDDDLQAFVVSEDNGTWHTAIEVPGTAALNTGNAGSVSSVSCPSAGNCTAVGGYSNAGPRAFVVSESNGTWGTAIEVPGTGSLQKGTRIVVGADTVSCASAGNCATGGQYFGGIGVGYQAWVASETNGTWSNAIEVPGTAALDTEGGAHVYAVSCASPGNCAAGGDYHDSSGDYQAFVVSES